MCSKEPIRKLFKMKQNFLCFYRSALYFYSVFFTIYIILNNYYNSKNYYELNLETNFFEDIMPGTKVRFQTSIIVGKVVRIETDLKISRITIQLKKNIPTS